MEEGKWIVGWISVKWRKGYELFVVYEVMFKVNGKVLLDKSENLESKLYKYKRRIGKITILKFYLESGWGENIM